MAITKTTIIWDSSSQVEPSEATWFDDEIDMLSVEDLNSLRSRMSQAQREEETRKAQETN